MVHRFAIAGFLALSLVACDDTDTPCASPHDLKIGMTPDEVIQVCGREPGKINGHVVYPGTDEQQWVYATWKNSYVYFKNGKVDAWDYEGKWP